MRHRVRTGQSHNRFFQRLPRRIKRQTGDQLTRPTKSREREVVESEAREQLFRNLLWAKYIESVTDHEGNVDDDITPELVAVFCLRAPIMAPIKVSEAVEKLRMTTAWMDELQGADFFPKP